MVFELAHKLTTEDGNRICCISFSPTCDRIAAGGDKLTVWKIDNGEVLLSLEFDSRITALHWDSWDRIWIGQANGEIVFMGHLGVRIFLR